MRIPARFVAAPAAALMVLALAGGCGGDEVTIKTKDGTVKVDKDGNDFSVKTDDGSLTAGAKLPEDFPKDAVPLIDGKVVHGTSMKSGAEQHFIVNLESSKSVSDAADDVHQRLTAAGFERTTESSMGDVRIFVYESASYQVSAQVLSSDGTTNVSYTVATKPAETE